MRAGNLNWGWGDIMVVGGVNVVDIVDIRNVGNSLVHVGGHGVVRSVVNGGLLDNNGGLLDLGRRLTLSVILGVNPTREATVNLSLVLPIGMVTLLLLRLRCNVDETTWKIDVLLFLTGVETG